MQDAMLSMIPELPLMSELDCAMKTEALRQDGLKDPQRLLALTLTLVRQVYTLEHSLCTALARISELQLDLDLATRKSPRPPIDQRFYEMTKQLMDDMQLDMP
jgi:hypothetical protein